LEGNRGWGLLDGSPAGKPGMPDVFSSFHTLVEREGLLWNLPFPGSLGIVPMIDDRAGRFRATVSPDGKPDAPPTAGSGAKRNASFWPEWAGSGWSASELQTAQTFDCRRITRSTRLRRRKHPPLSLIKVRRQLGVPMTDGLKIKHANTLRYRFVAGESHLNQKPISIQLFPDDPEALVLVIANGRRSRTTHCPA
jgi:hypothetical protein